MAISLSSIKRNSAENPKPSIQTVYATHGIGKTSYAAGSPNPIFLQTEEGLGSIEADTFGWLQDFDSVYDAIKTLYEQKHHFQTVVLDSAGWLEPLIWEKARRANKMTDRDFHAFGAGYRAAMPFWREILDGLSALRNERDMGVIILAHRHEVKQQPPDMDSYKRYEPKLQNLASAMVQEYAEEVFFMNYRIAVVQEDMKDKSTRKATGGNARDLYTQERPAFLAKNRCGMPAKIRMPDNPHEMFVTVAQHIPYYQKMMAYVEPPVVQPDEQPAEQPAQLAQSTPILNTEAA
jgi:hypothetical protein